MLNLPNQKVLKTDINMEFLYLFIPAQYVLTALLQQNIFDCPPLLCCLEAPCGVLCPGLQPLAQETVRAVGVGAEDDQKAGAPLLQRQSEGAGLVQSWDLIVAFQYLKGDYKQKINELLTQVGNNRTRGY